MSLIPPIPGTKSAELDRTAEMFTDILAQNKMGAGPYFALMLLLDSGYGRKEFQEVADRLHPGKLKRRFELHGK